jgi:hypothetical protein
MAYVFPPSDDGAAHDDARLLLAGTLGSLPQEWTALRDPKLEGAVVDAVLVHPEMGVALVSLAPAAPEAAAATLRERLEHEHFGEFFPGTLPVVVLGTTPRDIPQIEKRLADAFRQAPRLAISNRDWGDAVVALLLESSAWKWRRSVGLLLSRESRPNPPNRRTRSLRGWRRCRRRSSGCGRITARCHARRPPADVIGSSR